MTKHIVQKDILLDFDKRKADLELVLSVCLINNESKLSNGGSDGDGDGDGIFPRLSNIIGHGKCSTLDKSKQYPKITNEVVTVKLGRMVELRRLSMKFPNMGKGSKFPANISKNDDGTNLIFTTGAIVTPGCETYYCAKYLAHLMRLMIESVEIPMLVVNPVTGRKRIIIRNLTGLTDFTGFRVVNIVSNGRLTRGYISLAEMEADDYRLDWNPNYFPGLEHVLTKDDVNFKESTRASMTIFDSGKGVGMGVKCTEDSYAAYQYVVGKALRYPDKHCVPKNSNTRFLYRQEQKRLFSIGNKQQRYGELSKHDLGPGIVRKPSRKINLGGRGKRVTENGKKQQQQQKQGLKGILSANKMDRDASIKRKRVSFEPLEEVEKFPPAQGQAQTEVITLDSELWELENAVNLCVQPKNDHVSKKDGGHMLVEPAASFYVIGSDPLSQLSCTTKINNNNKKNKRKGTHYRTQDEEAKRSVNYNLKDDFDDFLDQFDVV